VRHRVYGKHLGRNKNQRTALFKGLVRSLILHESIQTTATKSKAIKGLIDKLIVKGKEKSNASTNFIKSILPHEEVVKKLVEEVAPRYQDRVSGFTQVVRLGVRSGDGAMMVKMSLVDSGEGVVKKKKEKLEEVKEEKRSEVKVEEKTVKPRVKKEKK